MAARNYGNKTLYVRDHKRWDEFAAFAEAQGVSMSDLVIMALERFVAPESVIEDKLNRIRQILAE